MVFSGIEFMSLTILIIYVIPKFVKKMKHKMLSAFCVSFVIAMMFYGSSRTSIIITSLIFCISIFFYFKNNYNSSAIQSKHISQETIESLLSTLNHTKKPSLFTTNGIGKKMYGYHHIIDNLYICKYIWTFFFLLTIPSKFVLIQITNKEEYYLGD